MLFATNRTMLFPTYFLLWYFSPTLLFVSMIGSFALIFPLHLKSRETPTNYILLGLFVSFGPVSLFSFNCFRFSETVSQRRIREERKCCYHNVIVTDESCNIHVHTKKYIFVHFKMLSHISLFGFQTLFESILVGTAGKYTFSKFENLLI